MYLNGLCLREAALVCLVGRFETETLPSDIVGAGKFTRRGVRFNCTSENNML